MLEEDKKVCLIRGEAETEVLATKLENICILIIRFVKLQGPAVK